MQGPPILRPYDPNTPTRDEYAKSLNEADQEEFARMQHMAGLFDPMGVQQFRVISDIIIIVGGWASVTLEVFTRKEFGERYFTPLRFMLGLVVLGVYSFVIGLSSLVSASFGGEGSWGPLLFPLFILAYFIVGLLHQFDIFYRNNYTNQLWYSKSFGVSRFSRFIGRRLGPLPPLDDWSIFLYVEPIGCFLLGWTLALFGNLGVLPTGELGTWIVFASAALLFKNQMLHAKERDEILNMNDARIKAMYLQTSARGAPKEQTAGYVAVNLPQALDKDRDGLPDVFETPLIQPEATTATNPQASILAAARAATLRQGGQAATSPQPGSDGEVKP
jgi:hypothetical protein